MGFPTSPILEYPGHTPDSISTKKSGFLGELESVRGLAALSVAVYHCGVHAPVDGVEIWNKTLWDLRGLEAIAMRLFMSVFSGSAAVSMFFVLSGFVLFRSLAGTKFGSTEAVSFLVKRFLRIYPPLLVNIVVMVLTLSLARMLVPTLASMPPIAPAAITKNLLLTDFAVNGASWTLAVELLAAPCIVLAYFLTGTIGRVALILGVGASIVLAILRTYSEGIGDFLFDFLLGMLIASLNRAKWATPLGCLVAILGLWLARPMLMLTAEMVRYTDVIEGLASAYIIAALSFGRRYWVHDVLNWRVFRALGRYSYSFYLYCALVYFLVFWMICVPTGINVSQPPLLFATEWATLSVIIALPLSIVAYHLVERPASGLGSKLAGLLKYRAKVQPAE